MTLDTDTLLPTSSYLPNLGTLLAERGLKQSAVAWDLVRDPALVSDWTKGKRRVPGNVLPRLAELVDLSLADLLIQGSDGQINGEPYRARDEAASAAPLADQVAEGQAEPDEPCCQEQEADGYCIACRPAEPLPVKFGTIDPRMLGRSPQRLCWGCQDHPEGLLR